ncbi:hypothetical protein EDC04DRAFT_714922 [Pisolithus marmoratus]|nr:hypothetical protein EDC04DRAFT_714922 [Pisolithus marmoratus]
MQRIRLFFLSFLHPYKHAQYSRDSAYSPIGMKNLPVRSPAAPVLCDLSRSPMGDARPLVPYHQGIELQCSRECPERAMLAAGRVPYLVFSRFAKCARLTPVISCPSSSPVRFQSFASSFYSPLLPFASLLSVSDLIFLSALMTSLLSGLCPSCDTRTPKTSSQNQEGKGPNEHSGANCYIEAE